MNRRILGILVTFISVAAALGYGPTPAYVAGVSGDGTTDDLPAIQNAIDAVAAAGGGTVYIPYVGAGRSVITNSIVMRDHTTLVVDPRMEVYLADDANAYMITNDDWKNGTVGIEVRGGRWLGNRHGQTRVFGPDLASSYYGFGMFFHKAPGLRLSNLYIEETNAWGVAHFQCDGLIARDLEFWQTTEPSQNGDGITGGSSNMLIERVRGYTNDDMVAVAAYGAQLGLNELHIVMVDVENVVIRGVEAFSRDGHETLSAVALYAREGRSMRGVVIEDVTGETEVASVRIGNPRDGVGYFEEIALRNVRGDVHVMTRPGWSGIVNVTALSVDGARVAATPTGWQPLVLVDPRVTIDGGALGRREDGVGPP